MKSGSQNPGMVHHVENVTFLAAKIPLRFLKRYIHGKPEERETRDCSMSFLKLYFISVKANIKLFDISSTTNLILDSYLLFPILLLMQRQLFLAMLFAKVRPGIIYQFR